MTKVKILGNEATEKKELKKIEFVKIINDDGCWRNEKPEPSTWGNIVLLHRKWRLSNMDLMFVFDTNRSNGFLALGHFNDGVV